MLLGVSTAGLTADFCSLMTLTKMSIKTGKRWHTFTRTGNNERATRGKEMSNTFGKREGARKAFSDLTE